jgi:hypothetical protein
MVSLRGVLVDDFVAPAEGGGGDDEDDGDERAAKRLNVGRGLH